MADYAGGFIVSETVDAKGRMRLRGTGPFSLPSPTDTDPPVHLKSHVVLSGRPVGNRFIFTIEDNGRGFDWAHVKERPYDQRGLGLATMKERARMSGGQLTITTGPHTQGNRMKNSVIINSMGYKALFRFCALFKNIDFLTI